MQSGSYKDADDVGDGDSDDLQSVGVSMLQRHTHGTAMAERKVTVLMMLVVHCNPL